MSVQTETGQKDAPAIGGTTRVAAGAQAGGARKNTQNPMPALSHTSIILSTAKAYHDRGLAVIPVKPGQKAAAIRGWQERRQSWPELQAYLSRHGKSGLGIVTGRLSGNLARIGKFVTKT